MPIRYERGSDPVRTPLFLFREEVTKNIVKKLCKIVASSGFCLPLLSEPRNSSGADLKTDDDGKADTARGGADALLLGAGTVVRARAGGDGARAQTPFQHPVHHGACPRIEGLRRAQGLWCDLPILSAGERGGVFAADARQRHQPLFRELLPGSRLGACRGGEDLGR